MATTSAESRKSRALLARASQDLPPGHPKLDELRADYKALRLGDYIARVLSEAPPLTDEQRTRLAELLRPVRVRGGGDDAVA